MTGGRLGRIRDYVAGEPEFFMTYGDGVASIDIAALLAFHRVQGRLATVTAVRPPGRFGALEVTDHRVDRFLEKPTLDGSSINGGFFVLSPKVLDLIKGDATVWEHEPLETLARQQQLAAYQHDGFWQPMDTLREKRLLEELWASGQAEWKRW
jgi:glucose-1-phosphate cytidylyltransferase